MAYVIKRYANWKLYDPQKSQYVTLEGHVADLHFTVSHRQPNLIAIDKQPNDDVMHLDRAGKADRLAG